VGRNGVISTVTYEQHTTDEWLFWPARKTRHPGEPDIDLCRRIRRGGWVLGLAKTFVVPTLWDSRSAAGEQRHAEFQWPVPLGRKMNTGNIQAIWRAGTSEDATLLPRGRLRRALKAIAEGKAERREFEGR